MGSVRRFIERKLKLLVNKEKSKVSRTSDVKFLGMTIMKGMIAISRQSFQKAMDRIKELTPRGTHLTLTATIEEINKWYRGWSNYYEMTQFPSQLHVIEAHIRRRLRARLVDQQKSRRNLFNKLKKRGVSYKVAAKAAFSQKKRWALSHTPAVERAFSNRWFTKEMGLLIRSDDALPHWQKLREWVRVT
jgi:hypothetical protein